MTATITHQMVSAYYALTMPPRDPVCMELLARFGYSAAKLDQGMALYQAVQAVRSNQVEATADYQRATTAARTARTAAWAAYQRLAIVTRATVKPIDPLLVAHVGLDRAMPRGANDFLAAAAQLVEGISASPEIGTLLAEYGYGPLALAAEQQHITAYRTALHEQQTALTLARRATRDHQLALQRLARWMTHYRQIALVAFADDPTYLDWLGTKPRGRRPGSRQRDGDGNNRKDAKGAKNEEFKNEEAPPVEEVAEGEHGAQVEERDQATPSDQSMPTGEDDQAHPIQQQE